MSLLCSLERASVILQIFFLFSTSHWNANDRLILNIAYPIRFSDWEVFRWKRFIFLSFLSRIDIASGNCCTIIQSIISYLDCLALFLDIVCFLFHLICCCWQLLWALVCRQPGHPKSFSASIDSIVKLFFSRFTFDILHWQYCQTIF